MIGDRVVHSFEPIIYRRGYVFLYVGPNTSMRFKNLKVTEKDGRELVGGVRDLDLADQPGSKAGKFEDEAKAGTVWKGKLFWYHGDKVINTANDFEFHVITREGMNFTGEFWINNKTSGSKIEGRVDALGNMSYVPIQTLGSGPPAVAADQSWFPVRLTCQ